MLWGVPENKAHAAKVIKAKQQSVTAALVKMTRKRTMAKFQEMQTVIVKAAVSVLALLVCCVPWVGFVPASLLCLGDWHCCLC